MAEGREVGNQSVAMDQGSACQDPEDLVYIILIRIFKQYGSVQEEAEVNVVLDHVTRARGVWQYFVIPEPVLMKIYREIPFKFGKLLL